MLYRSAAQPYATPTFKHIYGDKLARALKAGKLSASYRALLAHDLATGAVAIRLSRKQAIALTHANATYVSAIAGMSESERAALRRGQLSLLARVNRRRRPSDAQVFGIVRKLGASRVMNALDQITQPTAVAAE
jgi:hypothetical protein